jgi:LysR family nod box-dependent transcriptional activator
MTLRKYDLNLLTVLDALLRHRNVTQAGQELGLTQSATSHALLRLREQFGDKLLVPSGRSMVLTHRAEALAGPVAQLLAMAERIVDTRTFEPATATRRFKIGMGDYVAYLILPALLNHLQAAAPQVSLQVTWTGKDMAGKLKSGELDLAILPRDNLKDEFVHGQALFSDELVVIAAKTNKEVGERIDLDTYRRLPHAIFRNESTGAPSFADLQLARNQVAPRESVLVPEFLLLPAIVSTTNYIALVHRRLAERMTTMAPLKLVPPPFPSGPLHVSAFWSHEANSDAGHRWFREELARLCAEM